MTTFVELVRTRPIDMQAIADHLDSLDHLERVAQVRAMPMLAFGKLYAAAEGFMDLDLDFFVPKEVGDRTWVRHYGKNSLPVHTRFEKRFVRAGGEDDKLWGFNFQALMAFSGPGYFMVHDGPVGADDEVDVNYYRVPGARIPGGPPVEDNAGFIPGLVYGEMVDVMRGVSKHVSIGRAVKKEKVTGNYFLLCREDPLPQY
jgi:hypothetical protein